MGILIGTEKQINWAIEIIANIDNLAKKTIEEINVEKVTRIEKLINNGKNERAEQMKEMFDKQISEIEEVFIYLPKIKNSENVINMRIVADKAKSMKSANWRMISAEVALMAGIRL